MAQMVKNLPAKQEIHIGSLGREDPLEKQMATHSVFLPLEFHGQYWMLGAGALGRPRGMEWGRRREEGSGWGTHVYLWQIHFDIWQN